MGKWSTMFYSDTVTVPFWTGKQYSKRHKETKMIFRTFPDSAQLTRQTVPKPEINQKNTAHSFEKCSPANVIYI
jgi:hypothetical protein